MPMTGYESALAQGTAEVFEIHEQIKKLNARLETIDKLVAILNLLIPQPVAVEQSASSHETSPVENHTHENHEHQNHDHQNHTHEAEVLVHHEG